MVDTGAAAVSEASVRVEMKPESQCQEGGRSVTVRVLGEQGRGRQEKIGGDVPLVRRLAVG